MKKKNVVDDDIALRSKHTGKFYHFVEDGSVKVTTRWGSASKFSRGNTLDMVQRQIMQLTGQEFVRVNRGQRLFGWGEHPRHKGIE